MAAERIEGVREAVFSHERSEGFVTYDTTVTTVERILEALHDATDYQLIPRDEEAPEP